ncbi:MAG: hypothetical protein Q9202_006629 [Teloschistes flavicans]
MTSHGTTAETILAHDSLSTRPALPPKPFSESRRLAPEDAIFSNTPIRAQRDLKAYVRNNTGTIDADRPVVPAPRRREKDRGRSGSRRGKAEWKKLLWVKQPKCYFIFSYLAAPQAEQNMADPDNYTDPPTFLSHLQRNPRLQPYDFWPLVADSTVIVQHLSSVVIFICCFIGIYEDKVSPTYVSTLGNIGTVLGWGFWDYWVGHTQAARVLSKPTATPGSQSQPSENDRPDNQYMDQQRPRPSSRDSELAGLGVNLNPRSLAIPSNDSHPASTPATPFTSSNPSPASSATSGQIYPTLGTPSDHHPFTSALSSRNKQRLATVKSAVLIYCALLGLSPILKSLTISTSSDSIWAISASLMCLNIFFFDYGGGVGVKSVSL